MTASSSNYNAQAIFTKETTSSEPSISISPTTLSGFSYAEEDGPSESQVIAVIGRNIESHLNVTASEDYEISQDGDYFANTLSLIPTEGSVQTLVYVRLKAELTEGIYNDEHLVFSSGNITQHVSLNGEVSESEGTYYYITATANPEEGGAVTGAGRYREGDPATLTAEPFDGYLFMGWEENGIPLGIETTIMFTVESDRELVAQFSPIAHQSQTINNGWNWVSFYINLSGSEGLLLLEQAFNGNGLTIKSYNNGFVQYENGTWGGSLSSIEVEQMYQINTSNECTLTIDATAIAPEDHPITLSSGWNWIGYPSSAEANVANAFSSFDNTEGDIIKSQHDMSTFIDGYGWWGTLNKMTPGMGYMYNSSAPDEKTLVFSQGSRGTPSHTANNVNLHWIVQDNSYRDNASIIATIDAKSLTLSENLEVGAFVNGECRGATRLLYVEPLDQYLAFLTVFGDDEEQIQFMVYDGINTYPMDEQVIYKNNLVAGSARQPVVLHQGMDETLFLYPNPAKAGEMVHIQLPDAMDDVTVKVIDVMGRVVFQRDDMHIVSTGGMAPGIYTLSITDKKGSTIYEKLIIK